MTLDETIKQEEKIAENYEYYIKSVCCDDTEVEDEDLQLAFKYADEHRQLVNWLKELKKHRDIWDKIIAEICEEKECAYADFERYKVEYLGVDEEDVFSELPDDDFRYGMERCIDIIRKYKNEVKNEQYKRVDL